MHALFRHSIQYIFRCETAHKMLVLVANAISKCSDEHSQVRIQRGTGGPDPLENHKIYGFL